MAHAGLILLSEYPSTMSRFFCLLCLVTLVAGSVGCGSDSPSSASSSSSQPRGEFAQLDLVVGTGATATTGRPVTVSYTGWLYDPAKLDSKGTQFDSNTAFTFTLGAGNVIRGWDTGVVGMRVGGRRRLTIPPELAYGSGGRGTIPGNATLVFDIELLSVQ
jgi:FKBP-type peptidyl-prolyl cis-trans isomerase FkpA